MEIDNHTDINVGLDRNGKIVFRVMLPMIMIMLLMMLMLLMNFDSRK